MSVEHCVSRRKNRDVGGRSVVMESTIVGDHFLIERHAQVTNHDPGMCMVC